MRIISVVAIISALLICDSNASAQICAGRPSFTTAHLQLGIAAEISIDATVLSGELSGGGEHGLFGRGGIARESQLSSGVMNSKPGGWVFSGAAGYQLRDDDKGLPRFCPIASLSRGNFNVAGFAQLVRTQVQIGGTFGFSTRPGAVSALVPYAAFALARMSYDLEIEGSEDTSLGSDTYVPITFGVGWHEHGFALLVEMTSPVGLLGGDRSLALRGFIPLGFVGKR